MNRSLNVRNVAIASLKAVGALTIIGVSLGVLWLPYPSISEQVVANGFSIALPFAYIVLFIFIDFRETRPTPSPSLRTDWQEEYEVLGKTVETRENSLLVSGSIFVTAAAVLFSQFSTSRPSNEQLGIVFGSWVLYCIWLFFFQLTAGRLTDATFSRLRGIEMNLGLHVHVYLANKRDPVRRWIWLWLLNGLIVIGFVLLELNVLLLRVSLFAQLVVIVLYSLIKPSFTREVPKSGDSQLSGK